MARDEKLMVSFSVANDYVPDGLVVETPDYIVPFPPDHPESAPRGNESVGLGVELVELLLRSFWHPLDPSS